MTWKNHRLKFSTTLGDCVKVFWGIFRGAQYLKVCSEHGFDVSDVFAGDKLAVDIDYLKRAYKVIYEISVKLAHVLWRKLFPSEREDADNSLNHVCYELVTKRDNSLAVDLLEFATSLPKHHNDTVKRMMVINLAQAYKRMDKIEKCAGLLRRHDWSAMGYEFKLAVAVLNDEFDQSANLLKKVVNTGDLSEKEIVEWPLFTEFRKTDEFLNVFKELFDKDYAQQQELVKEEFNNHMDSVFKNDKEKKDTESSETEKKNIEAVADEIEKELEKGTA